MLTNDIIAYIENEVQRGVSHPGINDALVAAGWKSIEVADAFRVVTERAIAGTTGLPYMPPAESSHPQKESINQAAVTETLAMNKAAVGAQSDESAIHTVPTAETIAADKLPVGGFIPNSSVAVPDLKITETSATQIKEESSHVEHHRLIPVLIGLGALVLGVAGYFFLAPFLDNPAKKVASLVAIAETSKSIQYSGEYQITTPAGLLLPDKVLLAHFGGTTARDSNATLQGTFLGVDDWFDFRSKKNEVKFSDKISVAGGTPMEFSTTSRLISGALYAKLSESDAVFENAIANQGANWLRFDDGGDVPMYAYGFLGNADLYGKGLARTLATYISAATIGTADKQATGDTVIAVRYPDAVVTYFTSIFATGDKVGISGSIGPKHPATSFVDLPAGEITVGVDGMVKKAVIGFAYKTKDYALPVRVQITISYDRFDTPPAINIPSLVIPFTDLTKKDAASNLPSGLEGFFNDIRTIASVYKGTNADSYKGVCIKKGEDSVDSTELTIPYISNKVMASGYALPVCSDTETAWSYYTNDASGYYCTDSRGWDGKVARKPLGDKCN